MCVIAPSSNLGNSPSFSHSSIFSPYGVTNVLIVCVQFCPSPSWTEGPTYKFAINSQAKFGAFSMRIQCEIQTKIILKSTIFKSHLLYISRNIPQQYSRNVLKKICLRLSEEPQIPKITLPKHLFFCIFHKMKAANHMCNK